MLLLLKLGNRCKVNVAVFKNGFWSGVSGVIGLCPEFGPELPIWWISILKEDDFSTSSADINWQIDGHIEGFSDENNVPWNLLILQKYWDSVIFSLPAGHYSMLLWQLQIKLIT